MDYSGHKGKSSNGYIAGDIQLQILSDEFQHQDEEIQFIWDCGGNTKSQRCPLRKYIEPDTDRALGFHDLFTKKEVMDHGGIIKVICNIRPNKKDTRQCNGISRHKSAASSKMENDDDIELETDRNSKIQTNEPNDAIRLEEKHQNLKRKKAVQTTLNFQPLRKKQKVNHKPPPYTWEHKRFDSSIINEVFGRTCDQLGMSTSFGVIATIDCFATERNRQKVCRKYITKEMDFFNARYDSVGFWKDHVAWCYPPNDRRLFERILEKFRRRKMRGYLCVVNHRGCHSQEWCRRIFRVCSTSILLRADGRNSQYHHGQTRSPDDILIFYVNCQNPK